LKILHANIIIEDKGIVNFFKKCYNLKVNSKYIFYYTFEKIRNVNMVRNEIFDAANVIIKIIKKTCNSINLLTDLINENEFLYMKIEDKDLLRKLDVLN